MKLKYVFLCVAVAVGALTSEKTLKRTDRTITGAEEILTARVEEKVKVADGTGENGGYYKLYTDQGTFNTYSIRDGGKFQVGETYTFIVRGGAFSIWPPSHSRNIQYGQPLDPRPERLYGKKKGLKND